MRRSLGLLLLLISFFWHSAVIAGGQWMLDAAQDAGHALLHWQDEAHHHHDDGSYHADDSGDALAHVQLDGALQNAAAPGMAGGTFGLADAIAPAGPRLIVLPVPPPDGLRRPPRSPA